ncbi:MAG: hypothetical protein AVDCRST_MAG55-2724 [uncultured Rubrobacteraceae bacterium]|uniref:Uncharacterized protein n=1 Tax=uncultured Rubrobacteraceae bacterium TaxID=349277 RepID=A0A6J4Q1I6_9ACTN|nr:MAG: hypothetical protein AVDCRST_MAG55-2724 [uncultured Rubrobacteraceae bacterium]
MGCDPNVYAPCQKDADGRLWVFESWSDGCTTAHRIDSTEDPQTYTATFRRPRR